MKVVAEYPTDNTGPPRRYSVQWNRGGDWQETGSYRWQWAAKWNAWFDQAMSEHRILARVVDTKEDA